MARLVDLPTEILVAIAELLCPHCSLDTNACQIFSSKPTIEDEPKEPLGRDERDCLATLISLASSSKRLREVVQPISYHVAAFNVQDKEDDEFPFSTLIDMWMLYIRTVLERPDLGRCVRELHVRSWCYKKVKGPIMGEDEEGSILRQNAALFEAKVLESFVDPFPLAGPVNHSSTPPVPGDRFLAKLDRLRQSNEEALAGGSSIVTRGSYMASLLVASVPNIRRVLLGSSVCRLWPLLPRTLPCLEEIACRTSWPEDRRYATLEDSASIIDAAPSLQRIWTSMLTDVEHVSHPGVSELYFRESFFSISQFRDALRAFPSLRRLEYHNCTPDQEFGPRPADIARALSLGAATLEHVSLGVEYGRLLHNLAESGIPLIRDLRSLAKLSSLEIEGISVDSTALDFDREGLGVFPATIRRLVIRGPVGGFQPGRLESMIRHQRFPLLVEVQFVNSETEDCWDAEAWLPVRAACQEKGLKYSFVHWYGERIAGL